MEGIGRSELRKTLAAAFLVLAAALPASAFPSPQVDTSDATPYQQALGTNPSVQSAKSKANASINEVPSTKPDLSISINEAAEKAKENGNPSSVESSPNRFFSSFNLTDLLVAIATVVIACYAVRQYTIMKKMMVLANRPKIIVSFAKLHINGSIIRMPDPKMGVQYFVRNRGGTNAIITDNKVCLTCITGQLPYFLPYEGVKRINNADYTLVPGKPWVCDAPWEGPPSLYELFMNAVRGKVTVVLFGYIAYKDETGAADRKYFKRWWNPKTLAFEPYESKDHDGEEE